jgi:RHS repeat-associated protein
MKSYKLFYSLAALVGAICLSTAAQNATPAQTSVSEIRQISELRVLPTTVLSVSDAPTANAESAELLETLNNSEGKDVVSLLEGFMTRSPNSEWAASVQSNLGMIYHQRGRYTEALDAYRAVWEATKNAPSGNAKAIADATLASLLNLLSTLGRADELRPLLIEIADRPLPRGPIQLAREYAAEAYHTMLAYPDKSYRCGTFALAAVARKMNLSEEKITDLVDFPSGTNGITVQQLIDLSQQKGFGLTAVYKPFSEPPPVPSVIHWKENHYAAILEQNEGKFLVADPTFGSSKWLTDKEINAEASGVFLVPTSAKPANWITLESKAAATTFGKGVTNNLADWQDKGCPVGGCGCSGVPVWYVSEPFCNLWLADEPLAYTTKRGEKIPFKISYKQRETRDLFPPNTHMFAVQHFNNSWFSYIYVTDPNWTFGSIWPKFHTWQATVYLANGGELHFTESQMDDEGTHTRLEPILGTSTTLFQNQGPIQNGFRLIYPDGSQDYFEIWRTPGGTPINTEVLLTKHIDPIKGTNTFQYDTPNGQWRLARMIDYEGSTNTLTYTNLNSQGYYPLVQVADPYGRSMQFTYNSSNWVSSVTDADGMVTTFKYNSSGWLTNMVTPYGTNSFDYPQESTNPALGNAGDHNRVNRAVRVTEPNGGKQLFIFKYQTADKGLPSAFTSDEIPSGTPIGTLDSTGTGYGSFEYRNSFYWNQKQYSLMSTEVPTSFIASDYKLPRIRHWLEDTNALYTSSTLSIERDPSPDGSQTGLTTWYDYKGKTASQRQGTETLVGVTAKRLTGQETTWTYNQYNVDGFITNVTTTYTQTNGVVGTRSASFVYDPNVTTSTVIITTQGNFLANSNSFTKVNILKQFTDFDGAVNKFAGFDLWTNTTSVSYQSDTYQTSVTGTYTQPRYLTNALQEISSFTYDTKRRVQGIGTPAGGTKFLNWNGTSGVLDSTVDSWTGTNTFTWTNGLVRTVADGRGLTRTFTWDNLQRIKQIDYSSDGTSEQFSYTLENGATNMTGGTDIMELVKLKDRLGNWTHLTYTPLRKLNTVVDAESHTNIFSYCGCGALESIKNGTSQTTSFLYDYQQRRTDVVYPDNSTVHYDYNLLGQITQIKDPFQNKFTFGYNNQGLVNVMSNQIGRIQATIYDIKDRSLYVADANSVTNAAQYDLLGRIIQRLLPDGGSEKFGYTQNITGPTSYTNALLNVTYFGYDSANRITTSYVPGITTNSFVYDALGQLSYLTNGNQYVTTWQYDVEGRLTNKVDHSGNSILKQFYFPTGWLSNRVDATGLSTKYVYDGVGNLKTNLYPTRQEVFTYDTANRLKTMIDPVGTTTFSYMTNGWLSSEDGPWANDTMTFSYTNLLRKSFTLQWPGQSALTETYAYDTARRLLSISSLAGNFTNYFQGASDLVKGINLASIVSITNTFDSTLFRLASTAMKNSSGTVLDSQSYLFDLAGQVKTNTRADASKVIYGYDPIGQLIGASGFESGGSARPQESFGYGYDPAGNLKNKTNSDLTLTFGANNRNQLTSVSRNSTITVSGVASPQATSVTVNGAAATLYTDKSFAKTGVSLVNGNNTFTAIATDSAGRTDTNVVNVNLPASASYQYDLNGNLTNNVGRSLVYDEENRLKTIIVTNVTEALLKKTEFVYDGLGRRRIKRDYTMSLPLITGVNLSSTIRNNHPGWVGLKFTVGAIPIQVTQLGRWIVSGNSQTHGVKLAYASTGADVTGGSVSINTSGKTPGQFAYASLTSPITLAANTSHYLVSQEFSGGDQWLDYDSQLTPSGIATIDSGAFNWGTAPYSVWGSSNNGYGPVNFRSDNGAWVQTAETRYIYDGMLVVQERDGSNNPTVTYTRGLDLSGSRSGAGGIGGLLARTSHGTGGLTAYYHSDLGGNVTVMANASGVVAKYLYDPYGNTISATGFLAGVNRYRFSSKEIDPASGLYYYGFRFYDPSIQRWLNEDPFGQWGGLNLYRFSANSPATSIDTDGRFVLSVGFLVADSINLGLKVYRGENTTLADGLWIAADIASVAFDVFSGGTGGEAFQMALAGERVSNVAAHAIRGAKLIGDADAALLAAQWLRNASLPDSSGQSFQCKAQKPGTGDQSGSGTLPKTEPTYQVDDAGFTTRAEGTISGSHPGRGKGYRPEPAGGRRPGDHRGHLLPENGFDDPKLVNVRPNIISEAPSSNLSAKKMLENYAIRLADQNPNSVVNMIAELLRMPGEARPFAVTVWVTKDGQTVYGASVLNK